jgi:putative transposase
MVTGGTYERRPLFDHPRDLQMLHDALLRLSRRYGWPLQAWAVFANHYHFVACSPDEPASLRAMLRHLHSETARTLNRQHGAAGRRVWFQYWESRITYDRSYLARLKYVICNPVHHHLVADPTAYPWCSAKWFEETSTPAFRRTVESFKTDRVNVMDDF